MDLDTVRLAVIVDERDHGLNRRSSSAWAKYALALRRISLACRSSRFSRSSAFSFVATSVGTPTRTPLSRSAFFTHSRSVCAVQPIFAAIDETAAHRDVWYPSGVDRLAGICREGDFALLRVDLRAQ